MERWLGLVLVFQKLDQCLSCLLNFVCRCRQRGVRIGGSIHEEQSRRVRIDLGCIDATDEHLALGYINKRPLRALLVVILVLELVVPYVDVRLGLIALYDPHR